MSTIFRANILDNWTIDELLAAFQRTYIPGSKTAVFYRKELYSGLIRKGLNKSHPPLYLKDRFMLENRALLLSLGMFADVFDRKLQQYIEADLVDYNCRQNKEDNNPKRFKEYKEPFAVLTLRELEAGFVVCLVPLLLTLVVFGVEWIITLKNLVVFLFIFEKYFDLKKLQH